MDTAFFVRSPRQMEELRTMQQVWAVEHAYEIAKTITLSGIDYENFSEGLDVSRDYLEENAALCSQGTVYRCLLVRRRKRESGILVIPTADGFVEQAAYYSTETA